MISMKKYQEWVDTQIYNKHLNKIFSISQRPQRYFKSPPYAKKSKSEFKKKGQPSISYYNGNKSSKQKLSYHQLSQENYRLMNRIVKTKPVVDHSQQQKFYNKSRIIYRKMLRKKVQTQYSMKQKNFQQYLTKSRAFHQFNTNRFNYFIKFRLLSFSISLLKNSFSQVWFELTSGLSKATSEKINVQQMIQHSFCFSFSHKFKVNGEAKMIMYYSAGIQIKIVGIFKITIPEFYEPTTIQIESISKKDIKIKGQIISLYFDKFSRI